MIEDLQRLGFFEAELKLNKNKKARWFKLFYCYKGVFVRIIIGIDGDVSWVEHLYFDSQNSSELKEEFFGGDLSIENILYKIKEYRETGSSDCEAETL